jgi:histidine triad (HIT) family protein
MCIFCKISEKEIPAEIVYEEKDVIAFNDIHPLAPVHILIIPKKHIQTINHLADNEAHLMGKIIIIAKKIAKKLKIDEDGYKLIFRVGDNGGQEIQHIHLHLIGGAPLFEDIHPMKFKK